jgi:putative transposase
MSQPVLMPGVVYHVYTHANGFENLFNSDTNFLYFLKKYGEHIHPIAETYAYCLMPNHFHFMIRIRSEIEILEFLRLKELSKLKESRKESIDGERHLQGFENLGGISTNINHILSQQFSNLFNAYTKAFNNMFGRKGSLFIPNFKRKVISNEVYMTLLIAYIHNNPVHHGFVTRQIDWPYSSFQAYVSEKSTNLNRDFMLQFFGTKEGFFAFHKNNSVPKKLLFDE